MVRQHNSYLLGLFFGSTIEKYGKRSCGSVPAPQGDSAAAEEVLPASWGLGVRERCVRAVRASGSAEAGVGGCRSSWKWPRCFHSVATLAVTCMRTAILVK